MPAVSVLIPTRNAAGTLDLALGSIAAQTFRDWEAIVVDDASTDDTSRLLAAWGQRDDRFRILTNGEHLGITASLQRALEAATAPLLARMDADDVSLPRRFERQVERLRQGDVEMVGVRTRYFNDSGSVGEGAQRYETWLNSLISPTEHDRDMFVECPIAHPSCMMRAATVRSVGGYAERGWPEDYDLLLRLWQAGHRMAKVPETLFLWREGANRASRTLPEYGHDAFFRCKAHYLRRTLLAGDRRALVFGAGPVGKAAARAIRAEGVVVTAFVDVDPRKVGQSIYGIPVLSEAEAHALHGEAFGLVALGQPGVRAQVREALAAAGWVEGTDFRAIA